MILHRFAQLVAVATFALLIAGALVTSTDSGLSVPDWPLSYGTLFPPMIGGIRFEHTHRLIAGIVGLLTVVLVAWLSRRQPQPHFRRLGWIALAAVVAQALLGGMTVLYQLPLPVSVAHACLGQLFFSLVVTLGVLTSRAWREDATARTPATELRRVAAMTTAALFLQLVLGAVMRHNGRGLWLHAGWAVVALALVVGTAVHALRRWSGHATVVRTASLLLLLVVAQIALGVVAAWVHPSVLTRTAHVVTGAALLATSVVLTLWTFRLSAPPTTSTTATLRAYVELTKPGLTLLAVATTAVGYVIAVREGSVQALHLVWTLLGTVLVGAGAAALNQYLERDVDALMQRTQRRPLPTQRLTPEAALAFGVSLAVAGLLVLAWRVNSLTSALGAATLVIYLFIYTPLKRMTPLCTLVGAIPGAIPPLMGWTAARGTLDLEAVVLFAILFLWQLPHFLAIAWLYRDDYVRAGLRVLTVVDPTGLLAGRQAASYSLALVPVALLPTLLGLSGALYFFGALALTAAFSACGIAAALRRSRAGARRLFLASIAYLPLLLTLMTVDQPR